MQILNQVKANYKYLASFFKSDWAFKDYPIKTWRNPNATQEEIQYGAMFTNWHGLVAHGKTSKEAIGILKQRFIEFKENNTLPRPGTKVPLQFASTDKITTLEDIAVDFFDKIIEMNYYDCFISDRSCLWDFGLDNEETLKKIKDEYGIEPSGDLILVDIFEEIRTKSTT